MALQEAAAAEGLAASPHDPRAEAAYAAALEWLTTAQVAEGPSTLADWDLEDADGGPPAFPGGVLLVSRDRAFLDQVARTILAIDPAAGTPARYAGNYTAYADRRARERERRSALFRSEQAEMARMSRDIARTREQAPQVEKSTTPRQPNVRRLAKKVAR